MFIPKGLYYTKNHLWLRKIGLSDFYIGITDYTQNEIGKIELVELELKDFKMKKDVKWGLVHAINQKFTLIAPLDCEIIAINTTLQENAYIINPDPYIHWFLRVTVKRHNHYFLSHEEYKQHIK
jgi:glycine cleavage system H protein